MLPKKINKILLIGISGTYNYGCEAIIRGTEKIIHEYYPSSQIDYASYRVEDDKNRLLGCNINIVKRPFNRYSLRNIVRKIFSYLGIKLSFSHDSYSLIKEYDAVFSIGGDIYTLSSENEIPRPLMKLGDLCIRKKIPYILWGCSVGPFDKSNHALQVMKKHLSNISLIVVREEVTKDYLAEIGITKNVIFAPDPAFFVEKQMRQKDTEKKNFNRIAINLSPLSLKHLKIDIELSVKKFSETIERIIEQLDSEILLVPHVICNFNENDDDYRYLEEITKSISKKYLNRVKLLPPNIGFVATKKELIKCNLVIAARMHCAINSAAAGLPTFFLSYSEKSKGMAKYVYGDEKMLLPIQKFVNFDPKYLSYITPKISISNINDHFSFLSNIKAKEK